MMIQQLDVFDVLFDKAPADPFLEALRLGSGFEGGKVRIFAAVAAMRDIDELIDFLRKEYGIGGCSHTFSDGMRGFVEHDGRGLKIENYETKQETVYTWRKVANGIMQLIKNGDYLTKLEKAKLDEVQRQGNGAYKMPVPRIRYE